MTNLSVANRFFNALLAGDGTALDDLFANDATFWTNFAEVTQQRDTFLPRFAALPLVLADLHFENVKRTGTPTGFVEQHTLCGITPSGAPLEARGCFIGTVVEGKITRIEEYIDSGQLAPLAAARSAS